MSQREIMCASCGHPARIVHQDEERDVHAVLATFVEPLDPFPVRRREVVQIVPPEPPAVTTRRRVTSMHAPSVRQAKVVASPRDTWSTRRENRAIRDELDRARIAS